MSLHNGTSAGEKGLLVRPDGDAGTEVSRQLALSVPESVRALGEPLEPFFEACGGRQTLSLSLSRRDGQAPPETCVFQQPFVLIGRCPESDLALADRAVSFRHFYFQLISGRWLFVDMPGISGASSEQESSTSGWLDVTSELTAGPYTLTFVSADRQTSTEISTRVNSGEAVELPSFELELVNARRGSQARQIPKISTSLTLIGRSRQCGVRLKNESVSKVHASLVLTPHGLWVVDLLGRDGVLVDGRRVYWKQLHDGAIIQIGRFGLRVQFSASRALIVRTRLDHPPARNQPSRKSRSSSSGSLSERSVMALVKQMANMQTQFFEHSQLQTRLITEMLAQLGRAQQATVRQDLARIDEIGRELQEIKTQLAGPPGATTVRDLPRTQSISAPERSLVELPATASAAEQTGEGTGDREQGTGELPVKASAAVTAPPPRSALPPVPCPLSPVPRAADTIPPPHSALPPVPCPLFPVTRAADTSPPPGSVIGTEQRLPKPAEQGRNARLPATPPTVESHAWLMQRMAGLSQERNSLWSKIMNAFGRKPGNRSDD